MVVLKEGVQWFVGNSLDLAFSGDVPFLFSKAPILFGLRGIIHEKCFLEGTLPPQRVVPFLL
jgi:hypothetical protein